MKNLNQMPDNVKTKPDVKTKPEGPDDKLRIWWEELQKRLRIDPHYIPITPIPEEEFIKTPSDKTTEKESY